MNVEGQVQVLELPEMKQEFNNSLQSNDLGLDIEIYQIANPSYSMRLKCSFLCDEKKL